MAKETTKGSEPKSDSPVCWIVSKTGQVRKSTVENNACVGYSVKLDRAWSTNKDDIDAIASNS